MHLLILAEDFYPTVSGGAHEQWRFAQIAAQRGHDVTVVTPRRPGTSPSEVVDGVEITRPFPAHPTRLQPAHPLSIGTRIGYTGAVAAWLRWWGRDRRFDAVYSASNTHHWVAKTFADRRSIPSVASVGYTPSMRREEQPAVKLWLERLNFTYGMPETVFCRVPAIRDMIADRSGQDVRLIDGVVNEEHIRVAHQQSETSDIRSKYAAPEERLLVVAGRLSNEKNVPGAVEVLHELPPEFRLVVVGDGPERETVEATIDRLDEQQRVTMCGQLSHKETLSILAAADGLVLSSHTEAYPTVVFEGLVLGCAVFATPVGILTEVNHPRLTITPVADMSTAIKSSTFEGTADLDEATLERYSMERFADAVLEAVDQ